MTATEILEQLKGLGSDSIKKTLMRHDIPEPLYGVKVEELKKIQKKVKFDHKLSLELYDSGIYDARYLAGLVAEPEKMSKEELQRWAEQANAPVLSESTVAWVASESKYGLEMALKWIDATDTGIASSGWATLGDLVSVKEDKELDVALLKELVTRVLQTIHSSRNRVKYTMNGFIIAVGIYMPELKQLAKQTAAQIGKVSVDMGDTACKVPDALPYIEKIEMKNSTGKKRKSARCL